MEPIAIVAASEASARGKAIALAAVTRGLQTQSVVTAKGMSNDSSCLLCGADGTPRLNDERNSFACDIQHMFVLTRSDPRPFFRLGFRANPHLSAAGACDRARLVAMDGSLWGNGRTDGSPKVWLYGRSLVDWPVQAKILRCELKALYETLLHVVPLLKATHGQRNGPQKHPQRPGLVHSRNQTPHRCVEKDVG